MSANSTQKFKGWMQVLRPANVITSMADGVAGWSVYQLVDASASVDYNNLPILLVIHALLYAGGIMSNDAFDAPADRVYRKERPIPKGLVKVQHVHMAAAACFGIALILALYLGVLTALWALGIMASTYWYNTSAKHSIVAGPLVMGLCRGLNFLLPMTLDPQSLAYGLPISMLPILYIAGITLSSRFEEEGGSRRFQLAALVLYGAVMFALADMATNREEINFFGLGVLAAFFAWLMPAAFKAWQKPNPMNIRNAVRTGVLGLMLYDASVTAIYWHPAAAVALILLLPVCIMLGKKFGVT